MQKFSPILMLVAGKKKSRGMSKELRLWLGFQLCALIALGIAGYLVRHEKKEDPTIVGPMVAVPPITVGLADTHGDELNHLRFRMEAEVGNEKDKETVTQHLPQVREVLVDYFTNRPPEQFGGSEGVRQTRHELHKRMQARFPSVRIRNVYITEYVMF